VKLQSRFKINTWHALPKCAYSFCSFSYNQENPGPSGGGEGRRKPFNRRDGAGLDTAIEYEKSVALYFCLVARNNDMEFNLATNVEGHGAFDDVVFKFREKRRAVYRTCYLQIKHSANNITNTDLLDNFHGPFSMLKYFKSHETIKTQYKNGEHPDDSFQNCHFIIYTNCELQGHSEKKWKSNDPLKILNTSHNGSYVTFDKTSDKKDGFSSYTACLSEVKLFQCQLSLEALENLIMEKIKEAIAKSGTTVYEKTERTYTRIKAVLNKWWKETGYVEWLTETSSTWKKIEKCWDQKTECEACKKRFTNGHTGEVHKDS
jgi:hypothetical protein